MTDEQRAVIEELRSEGYAIAILTPEDLGDADRDNVEELMTNRGFDAL